MEVMPSILSKRSFPAPATHQQLDPGYRDAPDPGQNCVIVFSRVRVFASRLISASAMRLRTWAVDDGSCVCRFTLGRLDWLSRDTK